MATAQLAGELVDMMDPRLWSPVLHKLVNLKVFLQQKVKLRAKSQVLP
jgi:hypothetical protein